VCSRDGAGCARSVGAIEVARVRAIYMHIRRALLVAEWKMVRMRVDDRSLVRGKAPDVSLRSRSLGEGR
jgi:hypothetical protein